MTGFAPRQISPLMLCLCIAACGGGGGDNGPDVSPAGAFRGVITTADSNIDVVGMVGENGRMMLLGRSLPAAFLGTLTTRGENLGGSYRGFARNGFVFDNGQLNISGRINGVVSEAASIDGSFSVAGGGSGSFSLDYLEPVYARDSNLPIMAGSWILTQDGANYFFTITTTGEVSGNSGGCNYTGQLTLINPDHSPFNVDLTETCGTAVQVMSGLGWHNASPPASGIPETLVLGASSSSKLLAGSLTRL